LEIMEFTRWLRLMEINKNIYLKSARAKLSNELYIPYEKIVLNSFKEFFVPCENYELMDRNDRFDYNSMQHACFYQVHCTTLEKCLMHKPPQEDDPLSLSADLMLRVSLLREKSGCASKDSTSMTKDIEGMVEEESEEELDDVQTKVVLEQRYLGTSLTNVACLVSPISGVVQCSRKGDPKSFSVTEIAVDASVLSLKDVEGFGQRSDDLILQFGKYPVKINSLMRGGVTEREIVSIVEQKHDLVQHRELVQVIVHNGKKGLSEIRLTPGSNPMMPWLSRVTSTYKYYRIRGMIFDYVPKVSKHNLALVNIASCFGFLQNKKMSDLPTYQKMRACSRWIHPVECLRAPRGADYLVGYGDPIPGAAGLLLVGTEGRFPDHGELGELWVTYEIELWGRSVEIAPNDTLHNHLSLIVARLGPEYSVARYLFNKIGTKKGDRVSVDWVNDSKAVVKDTGIQDVRIIVKDSRFPGSNFIVKRVENGERQTNKNLALSILAWVCSKWTFVGRDVRPVNRDYVKVFESLKTQLLLSVAAFKASELDKSVLLGGAGIFASRVLTYNYSHKTLDDESDVLPKTSTSDSFPMVGIGVKEVRHSDVCSGFLCHYCEMNT